MPIWDGNWIWLWQREHVEDGNVQAMIQQARETGLTGVLVKAHDGRRESKQSQRYMRQFRDLARPFREAGLRVGAWGYLYGNDPPGEAAAALEALEAGAEWYVADVEVEFEHQETMVSDYVKAETFCREFRRGAPQAVLGMSSFAITTLHRQLPWQVFAKYVDIFLPQVYWATMRRPVEQALRQSVDSYRNLGKQLAPVGQAYGAVAPASLEEFAKLARQAGCTGVSWWSWQHTTPDLRAAIARAGEWFHSASPVGKTVQDYLRLYLRGQPLGWAMVVDDTGYAPVRMLAEALGLRVEWQPGRIDLL